MSRGALIVVGASRLTDIASLVLTIVLLGSGVANAQGETTTVPPRATRDWRWSLANLTRLEMWSYFEPPPTGGDPDSMFVANRTRTSLTRTFRWADLSGAVQFVQFGRLPMRAVGPGFLGTGSLYYEHSGRTDARSFYIPALNVRLKLPRGITLLAGRFGYTSGAESPSERPKVEAVKRARTDSRLVGDFEWSIYQRAFDGVRGDVDRPTWHASAAWLRPTQGGFEDDAGAPITTIDVAAATVTFRPGAVLTATDLAAFVYTYSDDRHVSARPDNTGRSADRARATIRAIGGSAVGSAPRGHGELDWLAWVTGQTGSWYDQPHRAWSLALEAGYQWTKASWQPWVRGGYLYASGDEDGGDDRHGTFFPMLPTVRRYAFTTAYAPMNLRDAFVELSVRPAPRVRARMDVRRLHLAAAADRWYAGSGATRQRGTYFGYAGRPSGGHADLGTVVEGSLDVTVTRWWSLNGFIGAIDGSRVVATAFRGKVLSFGYLESVIQF